ncbi:UDP-glucuronosyltransferase [Clostridium sp. YIM B02505]|uniref:UDP-glucuronosyltransferase n=1 Tax=Clostridium yunnanense TaxID=2800325 RepID=A0ABS1EKX3_9CLOT|nr:UDP-glucuronosyltransferase [Clostridium yunnanense]MBK1809999.1 UDP-glucuronosyltransferase [Clostridium yunnanense]
MNSKVVILCSGFGLGFYVPGLLINNNFTKKDIESEVVVFEDYVVKEKRDNIAINKTAYHDNFKAALLAQRMPWDIRQSIDEEKVDRLLSSWKESEIENFVVLSGHWIFLLEEYKKRFKLEKINAQIVYIDCKPSPSWKSLNKYIQNYSDIYAETFLFDYDSNEVKYTIGIEEDEVIPFEERENRFMIHGGGWGMGTYKDKIPELEEQGFFLDVIAYKKEEASRQKSNNRYFMMDPQWTAWGDEEHKKAVFPPFAEIIEDKEPKFATRDEYHPSFDLAKSCKAMISKPGGGTLIDSLNACTPIILLDPFGDHEKKNAELWERLGFGISYDKWKEAGFDMEILNKLHSNLLKQKKLSKDYSTEYIKGLI